MRRLTYLVLLILLVNLAQASVQTKPGATVSGNKPAKLLVVKKDTAANLQVRTFDQAALKKYSEQKEFQYEGPADGPSWWDRFWDWVWWRIEHILTYKGLSVLGVIFNIFMLLLLVGVVVALIYFVLKSGGVD